MSFWKKKKFLFQEFLFTATSLRAGNSFNRINKNKLFIHLSYRSPHLLQLTMSFIRTLCCSFVAEFRVARCQLREQFVILISKLLNERRQNGAKQFECLRLAYPIKILIETHRLTWIWLKKRRRWKSFDLARMWNWHGVTGSAENHIRWIDLLRHGRRGWSTTC